MSEDDLQQPAAQNSTIMDTEAIAQATEAGRRAERERILALIESPQARGRLELAVHMALHYPDMPLDEAMRMLDMAPRAVPHGPRVH